MRLDVPVRPTTLVDVPFPDVAGTWMTWVPDGTWVLELPFTTPLSMNDRMKWQVKAKTKKPWREAAQTLARAAKIPACERIRVELWYTPVDNRARDPLNLVEALKVCEDGLVDAGVIPDDSNRAGHVPVMPQITTKGPLRPGGNRLWLVVTRLA